MLPGVAEVMYSCTYFISIVTASVSVGQGEA